MTQFTKTKALLQELEAQFAQYEETSFDTVEASFAVLDGIEQALVPLRVTVVCTSYISVLVCECTCSVQCIVYV